MSSKASKVDKLVCSEDDNQVAVAAAPKKAKKRALDVNAPAEAASPEPSPVAAKKRKAVAPPAEEEAVASPEPSPVAAAAIEELSTEDFRKKHAMKVSGNDIDSFDPIQSFTATRGLFPKKLRKAVCNGFVRPTPIQAQVRFSFVLPFLFFLAPPSCPLRNVS